MKNLIPLRQKALNHFKEQHITPTQEELLFIHGYKPALLGNGARKSMVMLQKYFHGFNVPHRNGSVMLFQRGDDMINFLNNHTRYLDLGDEPEFKGLQPFDYYHEQLGVTLGFPPTACEWFIKNSRQRQKPHQPRLEGDGRCGLNYNGFMFATHYSLIEENVEWLLENRPIPEELQTGIYIDTGGIPPYMFGDIPKKRRITYEEFKSQNLVKN